MRRAVVVVVIVVAMVVVAIVVVVVVSVSVVNVNVNTVVNEISPHESRGNVFSSLGRFCFTHMPLS